MDNQQIIATMALSLLAEVLHTAAVATMSSGTVQKKLLMTMERTIKLLAVARLRLADQGGVGQELQPIKLGGLRLADAVGCRTGWLAPGTHANFPRLMDWLGLALFKSSFSLAMNVPCGFGVGTGQTF